MPGTEGVSAPLDQGVAIRREQLRSHAAIVNAALFGGFVLGTVLLAAQWGRVPPLAMAEWVGSLLVALGFRALVGFSYRRGAQDAPDLVVRTWLTRFRATFAIHGAVWGLASWLLFPAHDIPHQILLAFAVTTLTVGALTIGAFDLVAASLFAVLSLGPLIARLLLAGGEVNVLICLMIVLFLGYLRVSALRAHDRTRENVVLRSAEWSRERALVQQKEFLEALHQTTLDLLARHDLDDLLQAIVERATALLEAPFGELALKVDDVLVIRAFTPNYPYTVGSRFGRTEAPLSWQACDTLLPAVVEDYSTWPHSPNMYDSQALRAVAELPILLGSRCLGVLSLGRTEPGMIFTPEEIKRGEMLARHAALVVNNAGIYADAVREAEERTVALRETEERFHAVFDHSPVIIALMSVPDGKVIELNEASLTAFGYAREEAIGRTSAELGIWVSPVDRELYLERLRAEGTVAGQEVKMRRKDGSVFPALYYGRLIQIGGRAFSLNTVQDITLRKRAEASLSELNAELEDKVTERTAELEHARRLADLANQAKSQFLANMSHEIRTPLNGVLGMIDVLRQTSLNGQQSQMVDLAHESGTSLLSIIEDILDFSKIEAGMVDVERAPLSISAVVEKVCELLDQVASKKGVELTLFTDPRLPSQVIGDAMRLRQVLHNIAGNAIKFSSAQAQPRQVSVRVLLVDQDQDNVVAEFQVTDNGIGMDEEALSRLFNSFTQADASITRRFGGTGLGLSISRNLTRLMGGEISVRSAPGKGSTFTVRLSFTQAAAAGHATGSGLEVVGLSCLMVGGSAGLGWDFTAYLVSAGVPVERAADLMSATMFAAECPPGPWVFIVDASEGPVSSDDVRAAAFARPVGHTGFLIISRGRRRRPRKTQSDVVEIDANVLTKRMFLKAVALAAGRESEGRSTPTDGRLRAGFVPTREQAIRQAHLILVAEDNKVNQLVVVQQLRSLGYAADVVPDGHEALKRWESGDYALLVTDLQMPGMDGYELSAAIRDLETRKGREPMPIVALSANALKDEAQRCRAAGMNDYLSKPAGLSEMKAVLEKWLPASPETGVES